MRVLAALLSLLVTQAAAQTVGERYAVTSEVWGCDQPSRKQLDSLLPDREAFRRYMLEAEQKGGCRRIKPGTRLLIENTQPWSGLSEVRAEGATDRWLVSTSVLSTNATKSR